MELPSRMHLKKLKFIILTILCRSQESGGDTERQKAVHGDFTARICYDGRLQFCGAWAEKIRVKWNSRNDLGTGIEELEGS